MYQHYPTVSPRRLITLDFQHHTVYFEDIIEVTNECDVALLGRVMRRSKRVVIGCKCGQRHIQHQ